MPNEPLISPTDILMARLYAQEHSEEINAKIRNHLGNEAWSNHAISIVTDKFYEFCDNIWVNEVEKKFAYGWFGYSIFSFGFLSYILGTSWLFYSFITLSSGSIPVISYWWGLLAVPLTYFGIIQLRARGSISTRLRARVYGPVSDAHQILKDEIESPRAAIVCLRNLRSDLGSEAVLSQLYFDFICDQFTSPQTSSKKSDSATQSFDAGAKPTSAELFKKGFLEAFGASVFKTLPALVLLTLLILVITVIVGLVLQ